MAAIPHDLLESELFGHERGAFTGAHSQSIGKFEQANGGTLFLDEIGEMPAEAQTRLLRALQAGKIRRVGGRQEIRVNVRIIAATNRKLPSLISEGRFREDLYYRLNVVPIHLPPLRDRREDVGELARHFLAQAKDEGLPSHTFSDEALEALSSYQWRGNVRELRNVIFRLSLLARDDVIGGSLVNDVLFTTGTREAVIEGSPFTLALAEWIGLEHPAPGALYQQALAAFEKPLLEHVLRETAGNQLRASRHLGINRNTLRKKLSDLGISADHYIQRG